MRSLFHGPWVPQFSLPFGSKECGTGPWTQSLSFSSLSLSRKRKKRKKIEIGLTGVSSLFYLIKNGKEDTCENREDYEEESPPSAQNTTPVSPTLLLPS